MREKTVKKLIMIALVFGPLLPAFMVQDVFYVEYTGIRITVFLLEYFAFMYVIYLFLSRIYERKIRTR